ncbi:GNAT family N-acetyltransferase [Pseudomonadota bacterium]
MSGNKIAFMVGRLSELVEDWRYCNEQAGLRKTLSLVKADISRLPYRRLRIVVLARSLLEPYPDCQPDMQLVIRAFARTDPDLVKKINRPSEARLCARRLAQGHKGLVAIYGGCFAGYAWGSSDTHLERVHPMLCPGDALLTDSFTSPAFRCRGIQTALTIARFQLFRELGYSRAICTIETSNTASLAVWQGKLKSEVIGTIDFFRIGPWYKIRYS